MVRNRLRIKLYFSLGNNPRKSSKHSLIYTLSVNSTSSSLLSVVPAGNNLPLLCFLLFLSVPFLLTSFPLKITRIHFVMCYSNSLLFILSTHFYSSLTSEIILRVLDTTHDILFPLFHLYNVIVRNNTHICT